eukprot:3045647-Rhodomonas_salina.1
MPFCPSAVFAAAAAFVAALTAAFCARAAANLGGAPEKAPGTGAFLGAVARLVQSDSAPELTA